MWLSGAVALVTGASSGIGAATAAALAAAGARLVLSGRDPGKLAAVAERTGATAIAADLSDPAEPARLAAEATKVAGRVDVLISNAGSGWAGPIGELSAEKASELIAVNLLAPIQLARALAPGMADRRQGRLVFVSSIAGALGVRNEAVYSAAKAGLSCFAESLSYELAARGVGVSVVVPGVVDTPFFAQRGGRYDRSWPRPISAERVAAAITDAVTRDLGVVYVPGWMRFPAWLHATSPSAFRRLAARYG
jgi:short-subunit dehydrogenase